MNKKNIQLFIILLSVVYLFGQDRPFRHGLVADIGGSLGMTLNYQYQIVSRKNLKVGVSIGGVLGMFMAGYAVGTEISLGDEKQLFVAMSYNDMIILDDENVNGGVPFYEKYLIPKIGYRWTPYEQYKDFTLHAYLSPIISLSNSFAIPWFGFGMVRYF